MKKITALMCAALMIISGILSSCEVTFEPDSETKAPAVNATVTVTVTVTVPVTVTVWAINPEDNPGAEPGSESAAAPAAAGILGTSGDITVKRGSSAVLHIIGTPNTEYKLTVYLPSGNKSTAKGTEPITTDSNGNAEWTWKISSNTKAGTGKCVITYNDGSIGEGSVTVALTIID